MYVCKYACMYVVVIKCHNRETKAFWHQSATVLWCCHVPIPPTPPSLCCPVDRVLSVLMLAVVKGEAEAVTKLLCSSHLGLDKVYTSLEMAQRYTAALAAARRPTMPSSVTVRKETSYVRL